MIVDIGGMPVIIDRYMAKSTWSLHDGAVYADSKETIEAIIDASYLMPMGIACEVPRYIPLPDLNAPIQFPKSKLERAQDFYNMYGLISWSGI